MAEDKLVKETKEIEDEVFFKGYEGINEKEQEEQEEINTPETIKPKKRKNLSRIEEGINGYCFTVNDKEYSFPVEINGFEYEIRECRACISEGKTHSDIYSPDISIYLSQLIYRIRMLWNMKFDCE